MRNDLIDFHNVSDAVSQEKNDPFGETSPSIIGNGHGKLFLENSK